MEALPKEAQTITGTSTNPESASEERKGAMSFEMGGILKLFLVVILALIVILLISSFSSNIGGILDSVCKSIPGLCGQTATDLNRKVATASFNALVLAHNCVLDPGSCSCVAPNIGSSCTFNPQDSTSAVFGTTGNGISGFDIKPKSTLRQVSVSCKPPSTTQSSTEISIVSKCDECAEKCRTTLGCVADKTKCNVDYDIEGNVFTNCQMTIEDKSQIQCDISNFNMQDNFEGFSGTAKDYIEGFGNPNFIVYFQKLPKGADSWKDMAPWFTSVGNLMQIGMCVTDIAGVRKIKTITGAASQITKMSEASDAATSFFNNVGDSGADIILKVPGKKSDALPLISDLKKSFGDQSVNAFRVRSPSGQLTVGRYVQIDSAAVQSFADNLPSFASDAQSGYSKYLSATSGMSWVKFGASAGKDAFFSYGIARVEDEMNKVTPKPQSLVLQTSFVSTQPAIIDKLKIPSGISGLSIAKPVVQYRQGAFGGFFDSVSLTNPYTDFYLASPCHADISVSQMDSLRCGVYSYGPDSNIQCLGTSAASASDLSCGFDYDKQMNVNAYDKTKSMLESKDRNLFQYSGTDISKIYLPLFGLYLSDIDPSACESYPSLLYCYQATAYVSASNGKVTTTDTFTPSEDQIQIACGKPAIITSGAFPGYAKDLDQAYFKDMTDEEKQLTDLCFIDFTLARKINQQLPSMVDGSNIFFVRYDGKFVAEIVKYSNGKPMVIAMKTSKGTYDGRWNSLTVNIPEYSQPEKNPFFAFEDTNYDGTIDTLQAFNCKVPAIQITVDADKYNSGYENYNYCYEKSKAETYSGVAFTVAGFATNAFIKKASLVGWALGTAVDCTIAIIEVAWKSSWPSGGVK